MVFGMHPGSIPVNHAAGTQNNLMDYTKDQDQLDAEILGRIVALLKLDEEEARGVGGAAAAAND